MAVAAPPAPGRRRNVAAVPADQVFEWDTNPTWSEADPAMPLAGPRSRYWMFVIWRLYPPGTPEGHRLYPNMPDALRRLFLDYEGILAVHFKAARWKAEVGTLPGGAPLSGKPHIQCFGETRNKKLRRLEVLAFLEHSGITREWHLEGCEPINPYCPRGAWEYIGKLETTMPGAVVKSFGFPPPRGLFPRRGGAQQGAGRPGNGYCTPEDLTLLMSNAGKRPIETWLPQIAHKMKVGEVMKIITKHRSPQFLGVDARKYNTWTHSPFGNLGKSTVPFLWAIRNRKTLLPLSLNDKQCYGRWAGGWNWPDGIFINEFTGNWFGGFHDFLDFLDNQKERQLEVKGEFINCGVPFIFINGNPCPEMCRWFFPNEVGDPLTRGWRILSETELPLLYRRFETARVVGGGILLWDENIPKERSEEQQFLCDLYMLREYEEAGKEEFERRWGPEVALDPEVQRREAEAIVRRFHVPVMDLLAEMAQEDSNEQQERHFRAAEEIVEAAPETIIDLNALPDETAAEADAAEAAYLHPAIDVEAEESSHELDFSY